MQVSLVELEDKELERNKKIIGYLVKNPQELDSVFANLEEVVQSEHLSMIERFRQMIANGISYDAIINMFKEFGVRAPALFALFVSIAVYKFYR